MWERIQVRSPNPLDFIYFGVNISTLKCRYPHPQCLFFSVTHFYLILQAAYRVVKKLYDLAQTKLTNEIEDKALALFNKKNEEALQMRSKEWGDGKKLLTPHPHPTRGLLKLSLLRALLKKREDADDVNSLTPEYRLAISLGHDLDTVKNKKTGSLEEKVPSAFNTHLVIIENPRQVQRLYLCFIFLLSWFIC